MRLPTRRALDERLLVRWPRLYAALARAILRLPPRSRLRRALMRRQALSGWAAFARGDLEVMLMRYAPDCQLERAPEFRVAGNPSSYRGHSGWRELEADGREAWERMDSTPLEFLDAGDVFVVLGDVHLRARGSGIELDSPLANVYWVERGLIVHQREFSDWDDALRAAGIPTSAADSGRPHTVFSGS